jgi:hypothetical protein
MGMVLNRNKINIFLVLIDHSIKVIILVTMIALLDKKNEAGLGFTKALLTWIPSIEKINK